MTERDPTVVVTSDDTLPQIVDRLREAGSGGHAVNLVVPIDSSLLLTASEFRQLKEEVDEQRLTVLMQSADPLRLRLAERLGVRAQPLPRARPTLAMAAAKTAAAPWPGPPDISRIPSPRQEGEPVGEEQGLAPLPTRDPESLWPDQNGNTVAVADEGAELALPQDEVRHESENPPRRWLPVAAALVALVAAAALAIRFVLPGAVVTIVPRTAPVAAAVRFDVTDNGKPLDDAAAFALPAQPQSIDVVWTGSTPATGVRVEPDATAAGSIELRNTSPEAVLVAAGTVVSTENDVQFAFADDVTVPGVDAATGEPGAATGMVRAVAPGTGGNVGTGEIGGRLPNGVYYSNRMEPTSGGTDKEFPIVTQADLDALTTAAKEAAPALAADALAKEESGLAVVPSSVEVTAEVDAFDHELGDDAEAVALKATLTLQTMSYDAAAARDLYGVALISSLNGEAPEGYAVAPDGVSYEAPVAVDVSDKGARLEIAAHADAAAVLDDVERQALTAALAGTSPDEAAAILAKSPDVAEYSIAYHPSWLAAEMPKNAGRIDLEIAP
jgi:hypothetical protein